MPIFASILAAVIPMVAYLTLLWKFDKYDKEPLWNVLKHFIWGAVGAILIAGIGSLLFSNALQNILRVNPDSLNLWEAIIIAPVVEEFTKGLFLLKTVRARDFDNLTDGLVYGGAIGLGFGMTENFLYFLAFGTDFQSWVGLVLIRSIFSAVMHCISTGTLGGFLGLAKFNLTPLKALIPFAGYFTAVFIHFMWNLCVSFPATYFVGLLFMLAVIVSFIVIFYLSLAFERSIIKKELQNEDDISLLPTENTALLYSGKGNEKEWVEENLRRRYTRNAVRLAFRKHQVKHSTGRMLEYYMADIIRTKEKLTEIVKLIRNDYKVE